MTKRLIFYFILLVGFIACNSKNDSYAYNEGNVFGTYYKFQINSEKDFSKNIDSVFKAVDKAVNSYVDYSEISNFNKNGIILKPSSTFLQMLEKAKKYHQISNGYFEPTLLPLIKNWGSSLKNKEKMDSIKVDSLMKFVSFKDLIKFNSSEVKALKQGVEIDLSAMGEGYALDAIASILNKKGVKNYMIEIGGEMICKGVNSKGKVWHIGIENPASSIENRTESLIKTVRLKNKSISTSGSYRKFYTDSLGNRYSHIIDAKTGYPVQHSLLSVSIISSSSTDADALSTACMSMGTEKAKHFIENNTSLEALLIYSVGNDLKSWQSTGFPK